MPKHNVYLDVVISFKRISATNKGSAPSINIGTSDSVYFESTSKRMLVVKGVEGTMTLYVKNNADGSQDWFYRGEITVESDNKDKDNFFDATRHALAYIMPDISSADLDFNVKINACDVEAIPEVEETEPLPDNIYIDISGFVRYKALPHSVPIGQVYGFDSNRYAVKYCGALLDSAMKIQTYENKASAVRALLEMEEKDNV